MSQSDNNISIKGKDDYHKKFGLKRHISQEINNQRQKKQEKILEYALDIRKFEIQLYWERTKYFTSLITGSFGGYALFASKILDIKDDLVRSYLLLLLTFLGFILSLAWYLSNRGSKYWQENWERHVDALEDEIIGSLYKTTLSYERKDIFCPLKAYPFSVSKINQIISLISTAIWSCLFTFSWNSTIIYEIKELPILVLFVVKSILLLFVVWILINIIHKIIDDLFKQNNTIKKCIKYIVTLSGVLFYIFFLFARFLFARFICLDIGTIIINNKLNYLFPPMGLLLSIVIIFIYFTRGTSQDKKSRKIKFQQVDIE